MTRGHFLMEKIFKFVDEFRVVEERQILSFFSCYGFADVQHCIKKLKEGRYIVPVEGTTRVRSERHRLSNAINYNRTIDALDVLIQIPEQDICWYTAREWPLELEFSVDDHANTFTVAVFDRFSWQTQYTLIPKCRTANLPLGEKDPRKHIAVVPGEDLIDHIEPLGFDMYVQITDRNTGAIAKWV